MQKIRKTIELMLYAGIIIFLVRDLRLAEHINWKTTFIAAIVLFGILWLLAILAAIIWVAHRVTTSFGTIANQFSESDSNVISLRIPDDEIEDWEDSLAEDYSEEERRDILAGLNAKYARSIGRSPKQRGINLGRKRANLLR